MPVGQGARNNIVLGGLGRPNLFDTNVKATSIDEDIFSDQTEVTAAEDADLVLVLDTSETPDKIKFITKANFIGEGLVAITGNVNNRVITATGSALVGESNLLFDGTILTNDGGEVNIDISGGDPHLSFQIAGTDEFTIGVDDDDSDSLKIDTGGTVGGATKLTLDTSGNMTLAGGLTVTGNLLPAADDTHDIGSASAAFQDLFLEGDITLTDAGTIATSAGDLTVDAEGDIILDANGANVTIKDDGTSILDIANSSTDVEITLSTADKNLKFKGTDGSSAITALDIDMAAAGAATFNSDVVVGGLLKMPSNTASKILVADGSSFEEVAIGDLSEISSIANDDVFIAIDTTDGALKKVSRSQVVSGLAASGAITDVVDDSTPQLGGNLDVNGNDIVSTSNASIDLAPNGTGTVVIRGNDNQGTLTLNCENNSHGQKIKAAPHSESASNTLTLPSTGGDSRLVSAASTATLTNKTLTTPKIAEIDSLGSGSITLDAEANIELNADGGTITFADAGASLGTITSSGYSGNSATATVATTVTITDNENTDEDNAVVFTAGGDVDGGNLGLESDGDLTYNPNSGTLAATNLAGTLTTAAQGNVTSLGTLSALTIDDVAVDGKVITMTGSSSDTAVLTAGTNGALSIVTTDAAAAAANITITADGTFEADGTTITLDSGGDIVLDAAGNDINFKAGGTSVLDITNNSTDVELTVSTADKNFLIKGTDGSSGITALDIDMALAGKATFNGDVVVGGDLTITGDDLFMGTNTAGHILVGDDTNYNPVAVSGDIGLASNGAMTIQAGAVEHGMLADDIISGQAEITSGFAAADELMYSDAGTIKRVGLDTLATKLFSVASAGTVAQASDHMLFLDGGATGDVIVESIGDFLSAIAGSGISVSSNQLTASGSDTVDMGDGFVIEDGDGTEVTITENKEIKFVEGGGIDINFTDTDNGTDGDPFDLTFTIDAAQTGITSIHATDLIIGEDAQTAIDFGTANEIDFKVDNANRLTLDTGALYPATNNQIDLGTASLEFKDAYFDGTVTADAFAGPLTGNADTATLATTVTITDNESTDEDNAIIFTAGGDVDGGNLGLESDGTLTYNPSTGKITATGFVGALTGNADTATLATTVTITDNENTNEDNAIIFTAGGDVDGGNLGLESDGNLTYNPSTGRLTATQLAGTLQTAAQANITSVGTLSGLTIADGGNIGSASDTNAIGISSGGVISITATTANTDASDGALTVAGGASVAADFTVGDDLRLLSDSSVLSFGADSEATITHADDAGLTFNSDITMAADKSLKMPQGANIKFTDAITQDSIDDHDAQGIIMTFTAGSTITPFSPVYIHTDDEVHESNANDPGTMPAIGVSVNTSNVTDGNSVEVMVLGLIRDESFTDFGTNGAPLFCTTTAGVMSNTAPTGSGDILQVIGHSIGEKLVFVQPSLTTAELA